MARAFAKIAFTDNVKQLQSEMGSRETYQVFDQGDTNDMCIDKRTEQFIKQRDSFYIATSNDDGWPYIQHRGGPKGFLKVLSDKQIGFADFRGNRQYLTVGNIQGNNKVCLFLMDYAQTRRLKIWGHAEVIQETEYAGLMAQLELADFRAPVERGIVITIDAMDWNCPKYITPRYTPDELEQFLVDN
ncbi:MAG TPA: pyridoxamine 5'-phosphate oxidase [Methylophaga aminisulfidivorans]|uniref:Pyridoxamine 5'-phosphate oxidase n=1 Tax=Methylophaga aminisulfidivorans TaxID=230105 RepID=A0A7C1ZTP2_9GAMM|nr:pyridoxamine 5'-phosphate oxidase [Methylophaga aminisulfidivorans]